MRTSLKLKLITIGTTLALLALPASALAGHYNG